MSDPRYSAGVLHGIALSRRCSLWGRFPWPDAVPSLGPRQLGPLVACAHCPAGTHPATSHTWVRYGTTPLCRRHAVEAVRRSELVEEVI